MYSKPFHVWKKAYKEERKVNKNITQEEFLELFAESNIDPDDTIAQTAIQILNGENVKNFYIESENLFNFLCDTNIIFSPLIVDLYDRHFGDSIICVHHKRSDMSSIVISKSITHDDFVLYQEKSFMLKDGGGVLNIRLHRNDDFIKEREVMFICNLLMYINTFPESVVDGPPLEVKEDSGYTVKSDPSISTNGTISPHFRRGHFRFLSSDRYKNKRGETIFVKPTFVKGDAKTVMELVV